MFIELTDDYSAESLAGLTDFSHVEIIFYMNQVDPMKSRNHFYMNQVDPMKIEISARHPRNQSDWPKVGIFSQRGKNRPNQLCPTHITGG